MWGLPWGSHELIQLVYDPGKNPDYIVSIAISDMLINFNDIVIMYVYGTIGLDAYNCSRDVI